MDFAAYDFWIKPIGLLILARILHENGFRLSLLDCLNRCDPAFGTENLKPEFFNGTGQFHRETIQKPDLFSSVPRRFSRYGLPLAVVQQRLSQLPCPDAILVTSGMTYWYPGVIEMIQRLKMFFPRTPVILGGIYASLCTDHARRKSGADLVIPGEGEARILEILESVNPSFCPINQHAVLSSDIPPLYELYPRMISAAILTSRGCPNQCPFCASQLLSSTFRRRSPDHVVNEIETLYHRGIRHFAFYDDALLFDSSDHIIPILEAIQNRQIDTGFHTPNGLQPGLIDERIARLMRKTGFRSVRLSFESSDENRQLSMGMKVSNDEMIQASKLLQKQGFSARELACYVLTGLPGQKREEVLESILFSYDLGMRVSLAAYSPIPDCYRAIRIQLPPERFPRTMHARYGSVFQNPVLPNA
ncbi:hypothetical protein BVY01_00640 [bacterium I07]|nr:hypothetical protein BVY01_00640 [bacterium I07]